MVAKVALWRFDRTLIVPYPNVPTWSPLFEVRAWENAEEESEAYKWRKDALSFEHQLQDGQGRPFSCPLRGTYRSYRICKDPVKTCKVSFAAVGFPSISQLVTCLQTSSISRIGACKTNFMPEKSTFCRFSKVSQPQLPG